MFKASHKRIASVTYVAAANRTMIDRLASRIDTANSGTRVDAFTILASAIRSTVRANCALWSTERRRSDERGQTRTNSLSIGHATLTVQTAGRWTARIGWFR